MATALRIVSPVGLDAPPERVAAARGLGDLAGRRLVMLSNAKHNIDLLLFRVTDRLREEGANVVHRRKARAVTGAGPLIRELSARAHGIVTGMGD